MAIDGRDERERELSSLSDEQVHERADRLGVEHRGRSREDVIRDIAERPEDRTSVTEAATPMRARRGVRLPPFTPFAPVAGWLTAWGAAALAASCLISAEVDLGLGLGIGGASAGELDASSVFDSANFWPSIWLLVVQAGAFLLGGYAAARLARHRGTTHALLAWVLAMAASGADAIVAWIRDEPQVIQALTLPTWVNNGLEAEVGTGIALAIFALVSLVAVLIGGALGQSANRAARIEVEEPTTA